MSTLPILSIIIFLPFLGVLLLSIINSSSENGQRNLKQTALWVTCLNFIVSIILLINFDKSNPDFQFVEKYYWLSSGISYHLGIDGISILLIILTTFLMPFCILASFESIKTSLKEYLIAFLILETLMIGVFCSLDLVLFYLFFEGGLIPMFLIIGIWGGERRVYSTFKFFLYTLAGSVLMLLAIIAIYMKTGTTDITYLLNYDLEPSLQYIFWLAFFASFASKVPIVPVHIWLPEAHVEAPTAGSVILAGILLKLGTYGFLRFSMPLFPYATNYFTPLVYTFACIAIVYTSLTAIRQTDLKRIIAYASVAHMNLVLIGMFVFNTQGLEGSILQQLSHGLVSGALFLCVGVIYDRHHTRLVKYYSGLAHTMPIYIAIFMFFSMANIALPGTSSFVGEFLILVGAFQTNTTVCVLSATGMILGGGYSLWLFNRVAFGNIKIQYMSQFSDVNRREMATLIPLIILTLVMGIYPEIFLDPMHVSCNNLLEHINISQ